MYTDPIMHVEFNREQETLTHSVKLMNRRNEIGTTTSPIKLNNEQERKGRSANKGGWRSFYEYFSEPHQPFLYWLLQAQQLHSSS